MHRMPLANRTQTIPHQKLIIPRREDGRGDIHQDGDPAIVEIGEGFAAEEDGGDDAGAQVTGEVGADGDVGEAPDHGAVGQADGEGRADGGDERVGRVEVGPDDDADEGVDEEFGEEEEAEVSIPLVLAKIDSQFVVRAPREKLTSGSGWEKYTIYSPARRYTPTPSHLRYFAL